MNLIELLLLIVELLTGGKSVAELGPVGDSNG